MHDSTDGVVEKSQSDSAQKKLPTSKPRRRPAVTKQARTADMDEDALAPGEMRVTRSLYLGTEVLRAVQRIAKATDRTVQQVMREGLRMVVAKYAKGSARE